MEETRKIDTASAIKAIAKMRRTCEVVLTRLTRTEIEEYSRKKHHPSDKQVNRDSCERKDYNNTSMKKKRARVIYSSDEENTSNSSDIESVVKKKKKKCDNTEHHHSVKSTLHKNSNKNTLHENSSTNTLHKNSDTNISHENTNKNTLHENSNKNTVHENSNTNISHENTNKNTLHENSNKNTIHENSNKNTVHENSNTIIVHENSNINTLHENSNQRNIKNYSEKEKSTSSNISKSQNIHVHDLSEKMKHPMKVHRSDSISKKKKKMELLFGDDDYDDVFEEVPKKKSERENKKHSVRTHLSGTNINFYSKDHVSEKNVNSNYLVINGTHKTNEKHWKENSYKKSHKLLYKSKRKSKIEYDKRSNKYEIIKKTEIKHIELRKLCTEEVVKNKTVVEHLPKTSKSEKIKLKLNESSSKSHSSPKRNDSEDLVNTVQGRWSSLGMQSPADRSDKIISNTSSSETFTLYKAVNSKNDVLLASGNARCFTSSVAAELDKNNSVSLDSKYRNEKTSENDGKIPNFEPSSLSTDKQNNKKKCLISTGNVHLNKNKKTSINNSTIVQSDFTSDRDDLVERNIKISENVYKPLECYVTSKDSCNPVNTTKPVMKSGHETELPQIVRKDSSSETYSINTVNATADKQCTDDCHIKSVGFESHTKKPVSCITELSDTVDNTSRSKTFSSDLPASVDATRSTVTCSSGLPSVHSDNGTETNIISLLESVDDISDTLSCCSFEIVETDATDNVVTSDTTDNLVTCSSSSPSEKTKNLSDTIISDKEKLISTSSDISLVTRDSVTASEKESSISHSTASDNVNNMYSTDINLIACDSNTASEKENHLIDVASHESENLNTVSSTSEGEVGTSSENDATSSGTVTNNNIGKIRVKDPKSLGIQSFGIKDTGQSAAAEIATVSDQRRQSVEEKKSQSVENRRQSVEEHRRQSAEHRRKSAEERRKQLIEDMSIEELIASGSSGQNLSEKDILVLRNYKKYFDELIESKLPKMGELLDLAIADSVRKDMRIHHAEKLSLPDLAKQEKQKAEKEYGDSLKTRGIEFTALLDSIIKKFDSRYAEDLIFALYSRILDVFKLIEKQNKKYITRTRAIIQKMLQKNNYRNEFIYKILSMKTCDFSRSISRISHCILMYNNMVKAARENSIRETQPVSQSTLDPATTVQANSGIESTLGPTVVGTFSHVDKSASDTVVNVLSTSEVHPSLNTQNTVQANTNLDSTLDQHSSSNSFAWDAFFAGMLENSVDNNGQVSSNTDAVPSRHVPEFNYNRNATNVMNRTNESQYSNQLPSYSSQPLSSVNNGGIVVNHNTNNMHYGSESVRNTENVNRLINLQTNKSVVDRNRNLLHLLNTDDNRAGSRTRPVSDLSRQNVVHQQINNNLTQRIMQKHSLQLNSNSASTNGTAIVRNRPVFVQANGNNISPNAVTNEKSSLLSRQESNGDSSRMNVGNPNVVPNVVISSGTQMVDRINRQSSSVMRNQSIMQSTANMRSELMNQNQGTVSAQRNTAYVSNAQQMENTGRVPFTVNWHAPVPEQSTASNHNYSPVQVRSNVNYSNQNTETATMQSNKLPQQQVNAPQHSGVIQRSSTRTSNSQQATGNQLPRAPPPPYQLSQTQLLLKYLLSSDDYVSFTQSANLNRIVDNRVDTQAQQSMVAGNQSVASRVVGPQSGNSMTWNLSRTVPSRPLANQTGNVPVQPSGNSMPNAGGSIMSNINVTPSNINTQRITAVNTNPNEISYQRIRLVGGVHNMKNQRSVIAPRPNINSSAHTLPPNKTQDRLPVISEVFTCRNFTGTTTSNNNTNNTTHAPVNTSCPSSLTSVNITYVPQMNNNSLRSHSTEVPISTHVNTVSSQNYQVLAPNNNIAPLMVSTVPASNAGTSNLQLIYNNSNIQSVTQASGYNFNTSVISNGNSVGVHMSGHSVSTLPCNNTTGIDTSSTQSGQSVNIPASGNLYDVSPILIQQLPVSEINEITGDVETGCNSEFQEATCARSGCNRKSNKVCSVCKSTVYCSHECQHINADSQGPCDNSVDQYSDFQLPDEYMDMSYLFSD